MKFRALVGRRIGVGKMLGALLFLSLFGTIFTLIERRWPQKERRPFFRRSRCTELVWWILGLTVNGVIASFVLMIGVGLVLLVLHGPRGAGALEQWFATHRLLGALPLEAQAILTFVTIDFAGYWAHREMHGPRFLWKVHAVHHATRDLDWFSAARTHPLNDAIGQLLIVLPLVALGIDPRVGAVSIPVFGLYAIFLHANVRWRFGFLRFVIATPAFHRWHHAEDAPEGGCNFSNFLPVWDLIFGTFYLPERAPERFGTEEPVPATMFGQLVYPFRRGRRA